MVARREVLLAAGGVLLPGCMTDEEPASVPCTDLHSDSDVSESRKVDLSVFNDGSDRVSGKLTVDGPDERRCDNFDLQPEDGKEYPSVFENGSKYQILVDLDGENNIQKQKEWDWDRYENIQLSAVVQSGSIDFMMSEH